MKFSASQLPTRRSIRLAILQAVASNVLVHHGSINLGMLFRALERGVRDSRYSNITLEFGYAFVGVTSNEMLELYEPVLNVLEQDHGPLICEVLEGAKGTSALPWGYAGPAFAPDPAAPQARAKSPAQVDDLWRQRAKALDACHPDQAYLGRGRTPFTIWHLPGRATKRVN